MSPIVPITKVEQICDLVDEGIINEVKPLIMTNDLMTQD